MRRNKVKEVLSEERGVVVGTWVQMASPESAEIASYAGFDFVIVDLEHGYFDLETAVHLFRAVESGGATPVIRLPNDDATMIMKALDAGAMGIIIPGVTTKEQAERIVSAAKYHPKGKRGACPWIRATGHGLCGWNEYVSTSAQQTMVWLLIEGADGIDNIDLILKVEGVDAIVMGPFDLSQSLGVGGEVNHPVVVAKLNEIIQKALVHGKDVMAVIFDAEPGSARISAENWATSGCRIIVVGADRLILSKGYADMISQISYLRSSQ